MPRWRSDTGGRAMPDVADTTALAAVTNKRDGDVRFVTAEDVYYLFDREAASPEVVSDDGVGGWNATKARAAPHDLDGNEHLGVSGATEDNLVAFDANGLPKDSGSASSLLTGKYIPYDLATGRGGSLADDFVTPIIICPRAITVSGIRARVETASSSGAVQVDIEYSANNGATWTSILTTEITIDVNENDSEDAATPAGLDTAEFAAGTLFRGYVDSAGTDSADLSLTITATAAMESS